MPATPPIPLASLTDPGRGSVAFGIIKGTRGWHALHARCEAPFGAWSFRDECLTADETVAWVQWLRGCVDLANAASKDARTRPWPAVPLLELSFLEPELSMQLIAAGGGWARLRVGVQWNAAPPSAHNGRYDFIEQGPLWLDLCVDAGQLASLADHIEAQQQTQGWPAGTPMD